MTSGSLGRVYEDGEILMRQGDVGDVMFVIQEGEVEVVHERDGRETPLAVIGEGGLVGEMAIFLHEPRTATVRARGRVRALTVDEQRRPGRLRRMSSILWDMFSGSAPYRDIFLRMLHPACAARFTWAFLQSLRPGAAPRQEA